MNRGKYLENQIEKLIDHVIANGYWGQKNHERRTASGVYLEGEPFDYYIMTDKIKWAFDAKECKGPRWPIKDKEIRQTNNLLRLKKCGFEAFFLVLFAPANLVRFEAETVATVLTTGRRSLRPEEGKPFDYKEVLKK